MKIRKKKKFFLKKKKEAEKCNDNYTNNIIYIDVYKYIKKFSTYANSPTHPYTHTYQQTLT